MENDRGDSSIFRDALNKGTLEPIIEQADRFKVQIQGNIQDIVGIYSEDNDLRLTGKEPNWLIELFIIHGFAYHEK